MNKKEVLRRNANKFSAFAVLAVTLFLIIFIGLKMFFPGTIGSSEGTHVGYVTSVEHNSNIVWGSNIAYFKSQRESSQEGAYCVNDRLVKEQLIDAAKNNKEIVISYKNNFLMWKWDCNGGISIIYKVEPGV